MRFKTEKRLWVLGAAVAITVATSVAAYLVRSATAIVHDYWPLVPVMPFSNAYGVVVCLTLAVGALHSTFRFFSWLWT